MPTGAVVGLTGATGHIGQVLLARLLGLGVEVKSVARRPLGASLDGRRNLTHTCADLRSGTARQALAGVDLVFHLAAQVWAAPPRAAPSRGSSREAMREVNVEGTRNVLAARPGAVVMASSASVYGAWPDNPLPLGEGHEPRPNPECPYASHKLDAERAVALEAAPWAAVRLSAVLGPHADIRVARSLAGYRLAVPAVAGCQQATQWLDEEDATEVLLRAGADLLGARRAAGQVLNAAPDDWLTAPDIARVAGSRVLPVSRWLLMGAAELGRRAGLSPFGSDRAVLICGPLALSCAKAEALLSWRARRRSEEVLAAALTRGWRTAPRNRTGP